MSYLKQFGELGRNDIEIAGGKAANLGELTRAGFPVPHGFVVSTDGYREFVAARAIGASILDLAGSAGTEQASAEIQALFSGAMPDDLRSEITEAYAGLGADVAVAVRSSATAEDLAEASFAGQQDTYLNIVGATAVLAAVKRCWASLWTDRAVAYRATQGIDPHSVRLAVVIQKMVDASVAGVLFTANSVTGRRRQAVIDASPGLGEAVVSGAVNPDHFVVNTDSGEIVERRIGDKRIEIRAKADGGTEHIQRQASNGASLTDEQIRALVALGARVEAHYGAPHGMPSALNDETNADLLAVVPQGKQAAA